MLKFYFKYKMPPQIKYISRYKLYFDSNISQIPIHFSNVKFYQDMISLKLISHMTKVHKP
jgi:hypothetical protein